MKNPLRNQIYQNLNLKDTETLLEIRRRHDLLEWQPDVFELVDQILIERLGELPPLPTPDDIVTILSQAKLAPEKESADDEAHAVLTAERDRELAAAHIKRGLAYDDLNKTEDALAEYREAVWLNPDSSEAWDYLNSAEQELEEVFEISAAKQRLDRAAEYALEDELESALIEIDMARPYLPQIAIAYNYLGLILQDLGQVEPAVEAYAKAVQLNPRFYVARENLAYARIQMEELNYQLAAAEAVSEGSDAAGPAEEGDGVTFTADNIQASEAADNTGPVPGWVYQNERSYFLTGWPGHRTLPGRTGYDPLESDFENAHMQGYMLRRLLTMRFRTHNPLYLLLMAFVGVLYCLPLAFVAGILAQDGWSALLAALIFSPMLVIGFALLLNAAESLVLEKPAEDEERGSEIF